MTLEINLWVVAVVVMAVTGMVFVLGIFTGHYMAARKAERQARDFSELLALVREDKQHPKPAPPAALAAANPVNPVEK